MAPSAVEQPPPIFNAPSQRHEQQQSRNHASHRYPQARLIQVDGRLHFGKYRLLHTLGEGEFGKVKLAQLSSETDQTFAIKFVRKNLLSTDDRRHKLHREIEILTAAGDHVNIVHLYDVMESEKYVGLIMEYASGGELFDHILAKKYLHEREARKYFCQLVNGVYYLHSLGIVHRDLKLENLLLDNCGNIKITDFGFANYCNDADLMTTSCGSPCYAAPELVLSDAYSGPAADVWSCGVILYSMLCGYLPYDDDPANPESANVNLLYRYILNSHLKFPDWVTEDARDLVQQMLAADPESRISLDCAMQHPWVKKGENTKSNLPGPIDTLLIVDEISSLDLETRGRAMSVPATVSALENHASAEGKDAEKIRNRSFFDKMPSPVAQFRNFIPPRFHQKAETITEESSTTDGGLLYLNQTQASSTTFTSSLNASHPSLISPADSTHSLLRIEEDKIRSLSNAESVNSIEEASVAALREHAGAIDPKMVSTTLSPERMIDLVYALLTADSIPSDSSLRTINSRMLGGSLSTTRKHLVVLECSWTPQRDEQIDEDDGKENDHVLAKRRGSAISAQVRHFTTSIKTSKLIRPLIAGLKLGSGSDVVKFTVKIGRLSQLSGVHCIEIHRVKGDKWEFKRLYDHIVSRINLQ